MTTDAQGQPHFARRAAPALAAAGDESWDTRIGTPGPDAAAVDAIAISGSDAYVGGEFSMAGGITASNVARWDGANWSALGAGTDAVVTAVVISGTDVYAGGDFNNAGGSSASGIAKWDGAIWSPLGGGLPGIVRAMIISGTDLYAGGSFRAKRAAARNIARAFRGRMGRECPIWFQLGLA